MRLQEVSPNDVTDITSVPHTVHRDTSPGQNHTRLATRSVDRSVNWLHSVDDQPVEEAVMLNSGALMGAGALVGELCPTTRRLRSANGSQIDILGCSFCVVSFLGLRAEFPTLVCDLSTDAIIGTDILGSILPHTLDIKHGLLFTEGGVSP